MENYVITIARGFGSGGKQIGKLLASQLGIPCYESQIPQMASECSGISQEKFMQADERLRRPSLLRLIRKAPDITEEMNSVIGFDKPIYETEWPKFDEAALVKDEMEIAVQINGKVRAKMSIPVGMETEALRKLVLENEEVLPWVEGKNIVKFIAVRNIVNIVVK